MPVATDSSKGLIPQLGYYRKEASATEWLLIQIDDMSANTLIISSYTYPNQLPIISLVSFMNSSNAQKIECQGLGGNKNNEYAPKIRYKFGNDNKLRIWVFYQAISISALRPYKIAISSSVPDDDAYYLENT